ncbi:MAG: hypothetical protein R3185_04230 [Candidatus Thermoplasmatota archaeon]|nr:hypothetical protein [Candidatus Thermoplasmatota archaeon]
MPSFIVHGLLPPLLLLALRLAPPRAVLWMLPFTWLPDIDYFFGVHRAWTGNLFILLPTLALWWYWREERPDWSAYPAVATFYLGSHLLMDTFTGGTVLFWPIWDQTFFWEFQVFIDTETNRPVPVSEIGSHEGAPTVSRFFRWISTFETAMVALTAVVVGVTLFVKGLKTRKEIWLEEIGSSARREGGQEGTAGSGRSPETPSSKTE